MEIPCSLRYTRELSAEAPSQRRKVCWTFKSRALEWKSRALMANVREAGEGAEVVSAALAQTQ